VKNAENHDVDDEDADAPPASGEAANACKVTHRPPDAAGDGLLGDHVCLFDLDIEDVVLLLFRFEGLVDLDDGCRRGLDDGEVDHDETDGVFQGHGQQDEGDGGNGNHSDAPERHPVVRILPVELIGFIFQYILHAS